MNWYIDDGNHYRQLEAKLRKSDGGFASCEDIDACHKSQHSLSCQRVPSGTLTFTVVDYAQSFFGLLSAAYVRPFPITHSENGIRSCSESGLDARYPVKRRHYCWLIRSLSKRGEIIREISSPPMIRCSLNSARVVGPCRPPSFMSSDATSSVLLLLDIGSGLWVAYHVRAEYWSTLH